MNDQPDARRRFFVVLSVAIGVAPFLAFAYRIEAGLLVMALSLLAVTWFLREALATTSLRSQRGPRALVGINLVLALGCLIALVWLVLRG